MRLLVSPWFLALAFLCGLNDGCDSRCYSEPEGGTTLVVGGTVLGATTWDDADHKVTKVTFRHDDNVIQDLVLCGTPALSPQTHYGIQLVGHPGTAECYKVEQIRFEPLDQVESGDSQ